MGGAGIAPLCRVRKPCSACPIEARSGHVTTNVGRPLGSSAHRPTPMHALPCVFPERSRRSRRLLRRVTRTRSVSCDAFAQKRPSKRTAPERGNRRRGDSPPRGAVHPRCHHQRRRSTPVGILPWSTALLTLRAPGPLPRFPRVLRVFPKNSQAPWVSRCSSVQFAPSLRITQSWESDTVSVTVTFHTLSAILTFSLLRSNSRLCSPRTTAGKLEI